MPKASQVVKKTTANDGLAAGYRVSRLPFWVLNSNQRGAAYLAGAQIRGMTQGVGHEEGNFLKGNRIGDVV